MDIITIVKNANDILYSVINVISRCRYIFDYPKYRKYIKNNGELKNKYFGETCYILGNGPSVKNLDISLLKGKYTFAVNGFYESSLFYELRPSFYCIYDRFEFERRKMQIQQLIDNNADNMKFFFSRRAIGQLVNDSDCYYVYSTILPTCHNNKYDITTNSNTFINVLGFCIMCAIFMGFKKIVLLGNDFSRFASQKQHHFYDVDRHITRKESMYQELQGNAIAIMQHKRLADYCRKNEIEIVNATQESLMDVYPIVNLEDCL